MSTLLRLDNAHRLFYGADELSAVYRDGTLLWPWTPQKLFTAGVIGAWYDINDLSTLFQERTGGGTTPAVVNGVVGTVRDKSGQGHHAEAVSDAGRPILRQSGWRYYLEFDGVDDRMFTADIVTAGRPTYPAFVGAEFSKRGNGADAATFSIFNVATSYVGLSNGGASQRFNANHRNPTDGVVAATQATNSMAIGVQRTIMGCYDVDSVKGYTDANAVVEDATTFNPANFATANYRIEIGRTVVTIGRFCGAVYLMKKSLTAGEINKLRTFLARTGGRRL